MDEAIREAQYSRDPSTQNGAMLCDEDGTILVGDHNRFPKGVHDHYGLNAARWDRPLKYSYIEHAERGAIFAAAKFNICTNHRTLVAVWAACADCARAIIQSGVTRLVRLPNGGKPYNPEQWAESIDHGDIMLHEAGIEIVELDVKGPLGVGWGYEILRDGEGLAL